MIGRLLLLIPAVRQLHAMVEQAGDVEVYIAEQAAAYGLESR